MSKFKLSSFLIATVGVLSIVAATTADVHSRSVRSSSDQISFRSYTAVAIKAMP